MIVSLKRLLLLLGLFAISYGSETPCGDWIPFKNEKCIKLVTTAALQTKEDSETVCKTYGEELKLDDVPRLITIKTEEKQKFLQKLLFEDSQNLDNVWLGLDFGEDGVFRWNDGTDLFFTNWGEKAALVKMADRERNCVHMESGEGVFEAGKWVRENCKKRNAILCERNQPWTVAALQNIVLSLKLEMERNKQKIASLENNPVPLNFTYFQIPGGQDPNILWPQLKWKDVSSEYAGLFFRVEGGNAAPFGKIQEDNTRRLAQVYWVDSVTSPTNPLIPADGSWSTYTKTGYWSRGDSSYGSRYRLTTGEIRPRNKSIKIWRRIN